MHIFVNSAGQKTAIDLDHIQGFSETPEPTVICLFLNFGGVNIMATFDDVWRLLYDEAPDFSEVSGDSIADIDRKN